MRSITTDLKILLITFRALQNQDLDYSIFVFIVLGEVKTFLLPKMFFLSYLFTLFVNLALGNRKVGQ